MEYVEVEKVGGIGVFMRDGRYKGNVRELTKGWLLVREREKEKQ